MTLLPCPKCFSNDVRVIGGRATCEGSRILYTVGACVKCVCGLCIYADTPSQAVANWNTRSSQWQPIDTAPKDGSPILAVVTGYKYHGKQAPFLKPFVASVEWSDPDQEWVLAHAEDLYEAYIFSLWQPLPEPPK